MARSLFSIHCKITAVRLKGTLSHYLLLPTGISSKFKAYVTFSGLMNSKIVSEKAIPHFPYFDSLRKFPHFHCFNSGKRCLLVNCELRSWMRWLLARELLDAFGVSQHIAAGPPTHWTVIAQLCTSKGASLTWTWIRTDIDTWWARGCRLLLTISFPHVSMSNIASKKQYMLFRMPMNVFERLRLLSNLCRPIFHSKRKTISSIYCFWSCSPTQYQRLVSDQNGRTACNFKGARIVWSSISRAKPRVYLLFLVPLSLRPWRASRNTTGKCQRMEIGTRLEMVRWLASDRGRGRGERQLLVTGFTLCHSA